MQETIVTFLVLFAALVVWKNLSPRSFSIATNRIFVFLLQTLGMRNPAENPKSDRHFPHLPSCCSTCQKTKKGNLGERAINMNLIRRKRHK